MFERSRRIKLDDGRELVVSYAGERFGWDAYIPGDTKPVTLAETPAAAVATHLDYGAENTPSWVEEFSERYMRDLREATRSFCDCCGYRTLLNAGNYEICPVCGWEDDRCDNRRHGDGADAPSGPNGISLTQAHANYASYGAAKETSKPDVRDPMPDERMAS